jgi:hypothetical protein
VKKIIYLILSFFIISCAVQGPIPGGDVDKTGPHLIEVYPANHSTDINLNEKITLFFDEAIDPNSVYKSLKIRGSEFRVTVIGKKIIIRPEDRWGVESILNISISRELSDYHKNSIHEPISLFFSFGQEIPSASIRGKVLDINSIMNNHINQSSESNIYEVGLYKVNGSEKVLERKTKTDQNLEVFFSAINDGVYSIIAINNMIVNPEIDITQREFSISNDDLIVTDKDLEHSIILNLGEPIPQKNISSVNFINQYYVNYSFTDGSNQFGVIDTIFNNFSKDFANIKLSVSLSLDNQFKGYMTQPFEFIVPNIIDTISPGINSCQLNNFNISISISEPLDYVPLDSLFYFYNNIDSSRVYIKGGSSKNGGSKSYVDEIILPFIFNGKNDSIVYIKNNTIKDLSGNYMNDAIIYFDECANTIDTDDQFNFGYGGLMGEVNTENTNELIVIAYNILTRTPKRAVVNNNKFSLEMLPPGEYFLQVYENYRPSIDIIHPYFPGQWEPFEHSMKFSEVVGPIQVRRNWDIEGIEITLK